jgi:hypothetical protein
MIWGLFNLDWTKPAVTMQFHETINSNLIIEELNRL